MTAIQLIWNAGEFAAPAEFFREPDVATVYEKIWSKSLFHEWVVYTIIFQAHLIYRYETIIKIPGLEKADFLKLCEKFNITLVDSEAFARDMEAQSSLKQKI